MGARVNRALDAARRRGRLLVRDYSNSFSREGLYAFLRREVDKLNAGARPLRVLNIG